MMLKLERSWDFFFLQITIKKKMVSIDIFLFILIGQHARRHNFFLPNDPNQSIGGNKTNDPSK